MKIGPKKRIDVIMQRSYHAKDLQVSTLLLHGTGDKIIDYKATKEFADNSDGMASIKLFEGGYHELHNDLCRDEMLKTITNWLNVKLAS